MPIVDIELQILWSSCSSAKTYNAESPFCTITGVSVVLINVCHTTKSKVNPGGHGLMIGEPPFNDIHLEDKMGLLFSKRFSCTLAVKTAVLLCYPLHFAHTCIPQREAPVDTGE